MLKREGAVMPYFIIERNFADALNPTIGGDRSVSRSGSRRPNVPV
jgi:hypothetical protein